MTENFFDLGGETIVSGVDFTGSGADTHSPLQIDPAVTAASQRAEEAGRLAAATLSLGETVLFQDTPADAAAARAAAFVGGISLAPQENNGLDIRDFAKRASGK